MKNIIHLQPKTTDDLKEMIELEIDLNGIEVDLNHIDTSFITNMNNLFRSSKFIGNIDQWDTSNVTTMVAMFSFSDFNNDISNWNVEKVEHFGSMFMFSRFNQNISYWNPCSLKDAFYMFATMSDNCVDLKDDMSKAPDWYGKTTEEIHHHLKKKKLKHQLDEQLINQITKESKTKI